MELFIRIHNVQPVDHPILGDNFRQAFPSIDTNNLPPEFARFERVPAPSVGVYEVLEEVVYQWVDGMVKDVWTVRPMTPGEKLDKQLGVKSFWEQGGFPSWTFDEDTCSFVPPTPMPTDGQRYRWEESSLSWVLIPQE